MTAEKNEKSPEIFPISRRRIVGAWGIEMYS
jgi:hypothetical protein